MQNFLFFIIMGIGSAACFVLYDAWVQEKLLHADEPEAVIFARAYRRAVPAILLTSCTTMMGFLSAGLSAIMSISTFGYFAALVIIFDFLLAITLFAATFYFCETNPLLKSMREQVKQNLGIKPPVKKAGELELGAFELFFHGPFFRFLQKWGALILCLYLLYTAFMCGTAVLYLRTAKEATPFLSRSHPIQIFISHGDKFSSGTDGERDHVNLIFGLGAEPAFGPKAEGAKATVADYKGIDPDDDGTLPVPIFGGSEVLEDPDLQEQIWEKCEEAMENDLVAHKDAKDCEIKTFDGVNVFMTPCRPGVTCVMQPLKEYLDHFGEKKGNGKIKYDWPPGDDIADILESEADTGSIPAAFSWLTGPSQALEMAHAMSGSCDTPIVFKWKTIESLPKYEPGFLGPYGFLQKWLDFQQVIGDGFYDLSDYHAFRTQSGWHMDGSEMTSLWIRFNATIGNFKPITYTQPIFDAWTAFTEEFDKGVPVHSCDLWGWYITQLEMVYGVVSSIGACCVLSWLVLSAGTANWILATYATATIMGIIIQVMGTLVWFNNPIYSIGPGSLGIIETIGLSIAVGMSVDYTVHIVNAYNNCPSPDRSSRIRFSMTLMGISITNGMIATNLSAFFLLLCNITFFTGFGTFIMMTIFYSWLSAFFILCPALLLFGPQGKTGEITFLKNLFASKADAPAETGPSNEMPIMLNMSKEVQTHEMSIIPSLLPPDVGTNGHGANGHSEKVVHVVNGRSDPRCGCFQVCAAEEQK
jgi:hypothetical protein